jgi:hypothetical protein
LHVQRPADLACRSRPHSSSGTGSSATPKIKTLPPDTTSVSREVLAQLVSYVRENANFSADVRPFSLPASTCVQSPSLIAVAFFLQDAFEKLEEVHRRWAQGS